MKTDIIKRVKPSALETILCTFCEMLNISYMRDLCVLEFIMFVHVQSKRCFISFLCLPISEKVSYYAEVLHQVYHIAPANTGIGWLVSNANTTMLLHSGFYSSYIRISTCKRRTENSLE